MTYSCTNLDSMARGVDLRDCIVMAALMPRSSLCKRGRVAYRKGGREWGVKKVVYWKWACVKSEGVW